MVFCYVKREPAQQSETTQRIRAKPPSPRMPPVSDLQSQLLATRRELAAVRRALQERRVARRVPHSSYDTVQALSVVLQHSIPEALLELRAERDRLVRDLGHAQTQLRTAKLK